MHKHYIFTIPTFLLHTPHFVPLFYLMMEYVSKRTNMDTIFITTEMLGYYYNGDVKSGRLFEEGADHLCKLGYIKKQGSGYIYTKQLLNETFLQVKEEDFFKIIKSNKNNKSELLLFYLRLLDSFDYNIVVDGKRKVIGHMTQGYFIDKYKMSKNSITRYISALEELGLIYTHNTYVNGVQNNLYCKLDDKDLLMSFANANSKVDHSNFRRSVSARYNAFIKNPASLSEEEIKQLHKDVEKYNSISNQKKDTSIIDIITNKC